MISVPPLSSIAFFQDPQKLLAFATLTPEFLVSGTALILLLGGVFASVKAPHSTHRLMLGLGLFVLVALLGLMLVPDMPHARITLFSRLIVCDPFSFFVKTVLVAATALTFLLTSGMRQRDDPASFEFPVLLLLALLGMMVMVSANDMITLYIGLELASLPLYVLAAFDRDVLKSSEAGLKYVVLGAIASGLILFGISFVYGFSGSTNFEALGQHFLHTPIASPGVVVGMIFMLAGLCFKVSAAPFHMWAPDVYEGAPTSVVAFLAMASKFAALAVVMRLLLQPFGPLVHEWRQVVALVSFLSMAVGAFGALTQTNIKRLLAYSSIGHAGYALMGLAAGTSGGVSAVLIYFTLYIAMTAGAFGCVLMMRRGGALTETLSDLAGLSRARPFMAYGLAALMFSMAGIPPFSGFFSKLYVFSAALKAGLVALAVSGVLFSVVACYYYLKIVKLMFFDASAGVALDVNIAAPVRWVLVFSLIVTCAFILIPTPLLQYAHAAAEALF